ncbi:MAG: DUF642 domain-containing protein [Verrucomicrobiota bacterium]
MKLLGSLVCTASLLVFSPQIFAQTRILCLGDSITQGDGSYNSYRRPLWQRLSWSGFSVDFVGSMTLNGSTLPPNPDFDLHHEGHSGWRADEIRNALPGWLANYTPDVVLLHIGSNDVFQNEGGPNFLAQTVGDIHGIIRFLQADNPSVTILLAKIIPAQNRTTPTDTSWGSRITALNSQIDSIASSTTTTTSRVLVVDQYSGFNPSSDTSDGIHPNSAGEAKMASKWFDTLATVGLTPVGPFANGSFESGFAGWASSGSLSLVSPSSPLTAVDGGKMLIFNWGQTSPNGMISQSFATVVGQTYTLAFNYGIIAFNYGEQRLQFIVQGGNVLLSQVLSLSGNGIGAPQWQSRSYTFTANSTVTTLSFRDLSPSTQDLDLFLDNVRVTNGQTTQPPPPPPPPPTVTGTPTNLGFEAGLAGWTATGNLGIGTSGSAYQSNEGSKLAVLNWGQTFPNGVLSQSFATVPGQVYSLSFSAGVVAFNYTEQRMNVTVDGNGNLLSQTISIFGVGNGVTRWVSRNVTFTANSSTTTLSFKDVSPVTVDIDLLLDNVRIDAQVAPVSTGTGVNLGFESGFSGWTSSGNQGVGSIHPTEGSRNVIFNWGQTAPNGVLTQTMPTVAGQSYTLAFDLGVIAYNHNEQRISVAVQGNSTLLSRTASLYGAGNGTIVWQPLNYQFTADSSSTVLTFRDVSPTSQDLDLLLDNVRITTAGSTAQAAVNRSSSNPAGSLSASLSVTGSNSKWTIHLNASKDAVIELQYSSDCRSWDYLATLEVRGDEEAEITHVKPGAGAGFYRAVPVEATRID